MSKERLERLKENELLFTQGYEDLTHDFNWLIEQAELTQDFAEKNTELNKFLDDYAAEKDWGKNVIDVAMRIIKEQAGHVDSMAHVIKLKGKEMRELSDFLKNRNIPLKELSNLVTVMDYVRELERELEESEKQCSFTSDEYDKLANQIKRYREAIEEILTNKISCWEVIENKLNFTLYKE